ncbi:hypothetical protein [Streptomyces flaveus]|jgi:hypothetical protein
MDRFFHPPTDHWLDANRRAGTVEIRLEAVGSATTIRLREVRLVR